MAYKKSKDMQRMNKIEPSVQTLTFNYDASAFPNAFIDLSQVASLVNRRFYRQGINWAVAGFKVVTTAAGQIQIAKLPNTWVMSNAWEKTFRAWRRQQEEALEDGVQESVRARFNDFKIFADTAHLALGFGNNLLPVANGLAPSLPGEWEASQLVVPNFGTPGNNYEPFLTATGAKVGGAGGSYSLVELYADSRATPQSPDPSVPGNVLGADNILNLMFDVGDNNTDVLSNVVGKNDNLPYDQDDYPGGALNLPGLQIHDLNLVTATTVGGTTRFKGGNFPCGLINIATTVVGQITLQIDLIPGSHRGYLCEPMTEM